MNKVIVVSNQNGSCSIVIPTDAMFDSISKDRTLLASRGILVNASADEILNWIKEKDAPTGRITDISNIPTDRAFRNAWTDINPTETVDIDINKAKEIKKGQFRVLRKPLLEALDIEYLRALETNDTQVIAEIITKKQELRDVTELVFPNTVEELKVFKPECLNG